MIDILGRDSPSVILDLDSDPVIDRDDAYMDLVPGRLSVVVYVLDGIRKQIDYASDYELMVTVKKRHRSIVRKREYASSASRMISRSGISLFDAVPYVKYLHPARMRAL